MDKTTFIAGRLREVLLDGEWIANTNYKEQIESVDWQQATHSIHSLNTIAALTYHINYYLDGLLNVLRGGPLEIRDQYSFDVPRIQSEEDWSTLRDTFLAHAAAFVRAIEAMEDTQLDEDFVDAKYGTWLRNLEGVIEHSYYHLGQISLIRKLLVEMKVS